MEMVVASHLGSPQRLMGLVAAALAPQANETAVAHVAEYSVVQTVAGSGGGPFGVQAV